MPIRAKITRFSTRPYTPDELSAMKPDEHEKLTAGHYEMVLSEENIDEILATDLNDLRQRILKIVEARAPEPIIVTTRQQ